MDIEEGFYKLFLSGYAITQVIMFYIYAKIYILKGENGEAWKWIVGYVLLFVGVFNFLSFLIGFFVLIIIEKLMN